MRVKKSSLCCVVYFLSAPVAAASPAGDAAISNVPIMNWVENPRYRISGFNLKIEGPSIGGEKIKCIFALRKTGGGVA